MKHLPLPQGTRKKIRRLYLHGLHHAGIADDLGVSVSTVSKHTRDLPSRGAHWRGHPEALQPTPAVPPPAPRFTPRSVPRAAR